MVINTNQGARQMPRYEPAYQLELAVLLGIVLAFTMTLAAVVS